jgi:GDP-D-mannose 3', 5'-epimerase
MTLRSGESTNVTDNILKTSGWFSKKKVLITGGVGFIGSHLCEGLLKSDCEILVVDNLWRGSLRNIRFASNLENERFGFSQTDLRDPSDTFDVISNYSPDIVFHLADIVAGVDYVFSNEYFVFNTNQLINSNVYKAVFDLQIPNLVYVGTACSYPQNLQKMPGGKPLVENQMYPADPESAYGWSKLNGEYEALLLGRYTSTNIGVLRLHNVYGPRSILSRKRSQAIPSLVRKAVCHPDEEFLVWGSGNQARDFVYVKDVVDALVRLPILGMNQGPIQIASGKETSIREVAETIIDISGKNIPLKFDTSKPEGDVARCGSYDKAKRILGWEPKTSLREGLFETYKWAEKEIKSGETNLDE